MVASTMVMHSDVDSPLRAFAYEAVAWMIREALERNRWNVRATSAELGVNRQALYKIAKRVGVEISRRARQERIPSPLFTAEFRRFLGARPCHS